MEVSGQLQAYTASPPGERVLGVPCVVGWLRLKAGLDAVEKIKKKYLSSNMDRTSIPP
jgi:hypothetical protein